MLHGWFMHLIYNRMTLYMLVHSGILIAVYNVFGTGGLWFAVSYGIMKQLNACSFHYG